FNQNGWGRSLHFLAAWCLVLAGGGYLLQRIARGHFLSRPGPARSARPAPRARPPFVGGKGVAHLRLRVPPASGGPRYGILQKCAYSLVIFLAAPLLVLTRLTMEPAGDAGGAAR